MTLLPRLALALALAPAPAPTLALPLTREGYFYLFYSGNAYYDDTYALGVARSKTLRGKYDKAPRPILKTSSDLANPFVGPGHNSVIEGI